MRPSPDMIQKLLPTPTTQDGANTGGPSQHNRNSLPLNTVVTLLPTPTAQAAKHGSTRDLGANAHGHNLWDIPHTISDHTQKQSPDGNTSSDDQPPPHTSSND